MLFNSFDISVPSFGCKEVFFFAANFVSSTISAALSSANNHPTLICYKRSCQRLTFSVCSVKMFMKLLILAIVLIGFAQADVPGTLVSSAKAGARRSLARSTQQCDGVNFLPPSCDSCTSIQACMGPVGTVYRDCELLNPDKPFCNNGECSATPSLGDHCIPNQINCLGSGYYPGKL